MNRMGASRRSEGYPPVFLTMKARKKARESMLGGKRRSRRERNRFLPANVTPLSRRKFPSNRQHCNLAAIRGNRDIHGQLGK